MSVDRVSGKMFAGQMTGMMFAGRTSDMMFAGQTMGITSADRVTYTRRDYISTVCALVLVAHHLSHSSLAYASRLPAMSQQVITSPELVLPAVDLHREQPEYDTEVFLPDPADVVTSAQDEACFEELDRLEELATSSPTVAAQLAVSRAVGEMWRSCLYVSEAHDVLDKAPVTEFIEPESELWKSLDALLRQQEYYFSALRQMIGSASKHTRPASVALPGPRSAIAKKR